MLSPRDNHQLIGHEAVEQRCLKEWQRGRLPHGMLITGPKGIGKATFAYRLARFILSGGEGGGALFGPESLHIPEESSIFRRVASGAHGDLLVMEPSDEAATRIIRVDAVRRVSTFLSLTPAESASRVIIVDSADDMNANASNALLKVLEEPPANAYLLLISHNPGKLLPTIRSRCRLLPMKLLDRPQFEQVMRQIGQSPEPGEMDWLHELSLGSPGLAMQLRESQGDQLYRLLLDCLQAAPILDRPSMDELIRKAADSKKSHSWSSWKHVWDMMIHRIMLTQNDIAVSNMMSSEAEVLRHLAQQFPSDHWQRVMESSHQWFHDTETLHLDSKQVIHTLLNAACGAQTI